MFMDRHINKVKPSRKGESTAKEYMPEVKKMDDTKNVSHSVSGISRVLFRLLHWWTDYIVPTLFRVNGLM